ncbi:uncharacterized protein PG986_010631 [Apiospora aurea]|uniref:Uncharacterized protein n=1 Tax=Apiospora aurea TaxID=335848 RepID=A0ABR1Q2U2_9PEZI
MAQEPHRPHHRHVLGLRRARDVGHGRHRARVVTAMYPHDDPGARDGPADVPDALHGRRQPVRDAAGRRGRAPAPCFLGSLALSIVAGVWCACSGSSLKSHIAARDVPSMAAGAERGADGAHGPGGRFCPSARDEGDVECGDSGSVCGAMFVATTYLVPAWGLKWWYGIITIVNAIILIFAKKHLSSLLPTPDSLTLTYIDTKTDGGTHEAASTTDGAKVERVTTTANHTLDYARYGPRTWRRDLRIFALPAPRWDKMGTLYRDAARGFTVPPIVWLLVLNGAFLGVYVFQSSTFAGILLAPPFGLASEWLGFVQMALIVANLVALPVVGYGSDYLVRLASRINKGVYEVRQSPVIFSPVRRRQILTRYRQPEFRLLTGILPAAAAAVSCVVFGQTGAHPDTPQWSSWAGIAVPYAVGYAAFLGANTVGITYVLDSWPREAGALLLVLAAGRGFVSFGLGYATVPSVDRLGYDGAMSMYAIVCGVVSLLGVPAFFLRKRARLWTQRHYWPVE